MNTLPNIILFLKRNSPFTTSIGLKRETSIAGSKAETTEMTTNARTAQSTVVKSGVSTMSVLKILSNTGLHKYASKQPTMKHPVVKANDSAMYLATIFLELSPSNRLVAISLARFPVCATVRLI